MTRRLGIICTLLALLIFSCKTPGQQQSQQADKGGLFIIGGGSRPSELVEKMIDASGLREGGYAVVLPMASSMPDSAIIWSSEQFIEAGITQITGFNFLPGETPDSSKIDSLKNAALIYISGGDQNRFMEVVEETAIEEAIHTARNNGALIAGTSAGAAVMSQKMITGNELRYPEYSATFRTIESENLELARGLGFLQSAIVDQHFIWRSRHNRLLTAIIENPGFTGIGIDESTAILVKEDQAEVIGESQVMVFSNPDHSFFEQNHKLGAKNLKIDIYLSGEKFDL